MLTEDHVLEKLRIAIDEHGTIASFARYHGLNPTLVVDIKGGRKAPSKKLLKVLGLKRAEGYVRA